MTAADVPSLKVKWAFGFPTGRTAYGQPTVVGGRFTREVTTAPSMRSTRTQRCLYWMYRAKALVRSSVVVGPDKRAYVGRSGCQPLCSRYGDRQADLAKESGRTTLCAHHRDSQALRRPPLCADRVAGRKCGRESDLSMLQIPRKPGGPRCEHRSRSLAHIYFAGTEAHRRSERTGVQFYGPSGATIWSSPTIDLKRKLIYVMTGNGYSDPDIKTADAIIAIDLKTGKVRWSQAGHAGHVQLGLRSSRRGRELPRESWTG